VRHAETAVRRATLLGTIGLVLLLALASCTPPDLEQIPLQSWLDNDAQMLRDSEWFQQHQYVDCSETAGDFWPQGALDKLECKIPEYYQESDLADSGRLFIKHFTPTDFLELVPERGDLVRRSADLTREVLTGGLRESLFADAARFSSVSVDSLMVGLDGQTVRGVALMVHPKLEGPIVDRVGSEKRSALLYQPFIEGAIGRALTAEEAESVHGLYLAALESCGENAKAGDQSGFGQSRLIDDYEAKAGRWLYDTTVDCSIHIRRR